jgi:hypothetical protein
MSHSTENIILSAIKSQEFSKNIWIDGRGSSFHYCNSDEDLFDQVTISEVITVGNRSTMKAENVG